MVFSPAVFIKPDLPFRPEYRTENPAPLFRKRFCLAALPQRATLRVCALGYGYCYLNGVPVSPDRFAAPFGDYRKTLWYLTYDVTPLLREGENVLAAACGNGCYNETLRSSWNFNAAEWRDLPKIILSLEADGVPVAATDGTWKCSPESATVYNDLRSGETFDARLYEKDWASLSYDDSRWSFAAVDPNPPHGVFRECICEPVREHEIFSPQKVVQTAPDRFVFDMGQNLSGYVRLHACGERGQRLTVRHAERLRADGSLEWDHMEKFYPESEIQTDRFICSGEPFVWSPQFTYHGFRYVEIEGVRSAEEVSVESVFVHQAVAPRTEFRCSDDFLNRLFRAGQISSLSNFFYLVSDCPSREKLGWLNDAHMSAEQFLTNFEAEKLLRKWLTDIHDAMREDGALPGIVPTPAWGYEWGNGPLSDGALFEIPYRIWLHTHNAEPLLASLPYFDRYLAYLDGMRDSDGFLSFGLDDWAAPVGTPKLPTGFLNLFLEYEFAEIAALAASFAGKDESPYRTRAARAREKAMQTGLAENGTCVFPSQTAVALLIDYGFFDRLEPLKQQLAHLIEQADFHHACGILGMRHLPDALGRCGLQELFYRVLTVRGEPSFRDWFDRGATTLWERWNPESDRGAHSRNHHMYSNVLSWMVKNILGIRLQFGSDGAARFAVDPCFFRDLSFAEGSYRTSNGSVRVCWRREEGGIGMDLTVSGSVTATVNGRVYGAGRYQIRKTDF